MINPYEAGQLPANSRRISIGKVTAFASFVVVLMFASFMAGYWVGLKDRHFGHDGSTFKRDWLPLP